MFLPASSTLSFALRKSFSVTWSRSFLMASIPASVQMLLISAPDTPSVISASFFAETFLSTFMCARWISKICFLPSRSGSPTSMILSNLPGLRSASSRMSGLLVAPMILTSLVGVNPSSSARSCMSVR